MHLTQVTTAGCGLAVMKTTTGWANLSDVQGPMPRKSAKHAKTAQRSLSDVTDLNGSDTSALLDKPYPFGKTRIAKSKGARLANRQIIGVESGHESVARNGWGLRQLALAFFEIAPSGGSFS
jgi:hypothetical protein